MSVQDDKTIYPRRIYPLSPRELTEEQLAVVFAMTSRRPEPFDEIARQVSQEKAADFHERWVLGYGHASVAEHAIIHMAVENISRLACDTLEDNRLASYTEKSSRFQKMSEGYYHVPAELKESPRAQQAYISACRHLFHAYENAVQKTVEHLKTVTHREEKERESAYDLRLRREAIDSCRFLLPAATLTNVGVTMNARSMEHAITKLLSSELLEERELGEEIKVKGREITPTLIKYAEENEYLIATRGAQRRRWIVDSGQWRVEGEESPSDTPHSSLITDHSTLSTVYLVHYDPQAEIKLAAALLYRFADVPYAQVLRQVEDMAPDQRFKVIDACLEKLGPHDSPVRELEVVDYTFEMVMDYGAYREFKRHRMQTYIPQPLTVANGYVTPRLLKDAGLEGEFTEAMEVAGDAFREVGQVSPAAAQYLVTHAHKRRVLAKMNLRECYHLFKLRTQPHAHFSIREPVGEAMRLASESHPRLFKHLKLRE